MLLAELTFFVCCWFGQLHDAAGSSLAAKSTWIVDVQDTIGTHLCTGSLISPINALTVCSCVMDPTMKRKLPRRVVHTFKGETQVRMSANHFPHLWCEPRGKAGRPTYNYAITRVDRTFQMTPRLIFMPFPFNISFDLDWNAVLEYRLKRYLSSGLKDCESVGWTYAVVDRKKILNLTSSNVMPSNLNRTLLDFTWLIGRILVEKSLHDGTPGRNLICDGFPYGFLDSWPDEDGLERYYRADHIIRWVLSNSLPPIDFGETEIKNITRESFRTPFNTGLATYWYFKGFCCHKRDDVVEVTGEAAWLFIAACVLWLSTRDLMPEFLNVCEGVRPLYNIVAVIAYAHIMFCYVWVEFLTALSVVFCYIDKTAKKAGFPILTDNILFTLKPHGGYLNLFSALAFSLWLATTIMWFNTCEYDDSLQWRCDLAQSTRTAGRAPGACYGSRCSNGSDDYNETGPDGEGTNTDNLSDLEFLLEQERASRR